MCDAPRKSPGVLHAAVVLFEVRSVMRGIGGSSLQRADCACPRRGRFVHSPNFVNHSSLILLNKYQQPAEEVIDPCMLACKLFGQVILAQLCRDQPELLDVTCLHAKSDGQLHRFLPTLPRSATYHCQHYSIGVAGFCSCHPC